MRYIIGIDLGTTNCCVAYIDTAMANPTIVPFRIPQETIKGVIEEQATLPSFCYLQTERCLVGSGARDLGAKTPTRLVQSAKSWLCHPAANRKDKILPIEATAEELKISPVEASANYLKHIKQAWDAIIAKNDSEAEFENQEIILTVPASFDEAARALTVEAAKLAGYQTMTLLEEPQAAFYSWIAQHEKNWEKLLFPGASILVCDIGGGTTDFSLIEVVAKEDKLSFQRMAVGNHLLLGGDNMDATVAHSLETQLKSGEFTNSQWLSLKHEARRAKEILLGTDQPAYKITIQGSGSQVIKNTLSFEASRDDLRKLLLEGFFGQYSYDEAINLKKSSGLRSMGLPYEDEPSVTKHLANFLKRAGDQVAKPDFVLFNGGALKPQLFRDAIINSLKNWFPEKNPQILSSYHLDLAVSHGAAYYGKVRRGMGVKIGGGSARAFYLVVDFQNRKQALTVLPRGFDEGSRYTSNAVFHLSANTPVSFQLCSSHVRLHDQQESLVEIDPQEMQQLPPIHTILRFGKKQEHEKLPVKLEIEITPIGTLEMHVKSQTSDHRWKLEFQLRNASGQENSLTTLEQARSDQTLDKNLILKIEELVTFDDKEPGKLMEKLEKALEMPRKDWPPSLLRAIFDAVLKKASNRKKTADHELRWWNLIGFTLRPGFGYPLDDFRIKELWKIILGELKTLKSTDLQIQMWICYRRIAGGLTKGQQMQLASELLSSVLEEKRKGKNDGYQFSEKVRALAAMELIEMNAKIKLGNLFVSRLLTGGGSSADLWGLARIGARQLMYGSITHVVPRDVCSQWINSLLNATKISEESLAYLIGQLARKTKHREVNLNAEDVEKILKRFSGRVQELVTQEDVSLTLKEQEQALGDQLPPGLTLVGYS